MKNNELWNDGGGQKVVVDRLGECRVWRRMYKHEFYQFKIQHGFTTVIGEPSYDNRTALNNAFSELKKHFKSILN